MNITLNGFTVPEDGSQITCIDIKDFHTLVSLKRIEKCLLACPNVKRVRMSLSAYEIPKEKMNHGIGEIISKIATYGKNIESLFFRIPFLSDHEVSFLSQDNLPKLREVIIHRNKKIGAKGIEYIASQCPDLTSLDLSYSLYKETDEAAHHIGYFLKKLKRINMHRSCNLSDAGLITIVEGCRHLEIIEVGRNYELTDNSMKKISENCSELTTLAMYYNKKITEKGIQYIVNGCPKFKNFKNGTGWSENPNLKEIKANYPTINFS